LIPPSIQQVPDADSALGLAVSYVAGHQPFGSYRADRLVGSLVGQIQRRHYAFAVRNGTIVGYVGWALCERETARTWLEGGEAPNSEGSRHGSVLVPIVVIADDRQALRQLTVFMRRLHGGRPYMGRRALRTVNAIRRGQVGRERNV